MYVGGNTFQMFKQISEETYYESIQSSFVKLDKDMGYQRSLVNLFKELGAYDFSFYWNDDHGFWGYAFSAWLDGRKFQLVQARAPLARPQYELSIEGEKFRANDKKQLESAIYEALGVKVNIESGFRLKAPKSQIINNARVIHRPLYSEWISEDEFKYRDELETIKPYIDRNSNISYYSNGPSEDSSQAVEFQSQAQPVRVWFNKNSPAFFEILDGSDQRFPLSKLGLLTI